LKSYEVGAKMLILAIDSSAKSACVAVCEDKTLIGQYFQNSGLTHSRTLLSMTENLLKNLERTVSDIDLVAVSNGPGSFTGVRIGVAATKGLAWGADKPVCGVSTLEAMAHQVDEPDVLICAVMDARRNQVYNALFKQTEEAPERQCADRAIAPEDLVSELRMSDLPIYLIGDGAALTYDYLKKAGIPCRLAPQLLRYQTAYGVALASINAQCIPPAELEPSYLRPSQAERELSARG